MKKVGIIDIGSSSIRLVIYEFSSDNTYSLIEDIRTNVRMSENLTSSEVKKLLEI